MFTVTVRILYPFNANRPSGNFGSAAIRTLKQTAHNSTVITTRGDRRNGRPDARYERPELSFADSENEKIN
ncbi:MAG: hypothetical protein ACPHUF_17150, partial [Gammaproteobacteria bacterium]